MLRRSRPGDLVAVVGDEESVGPELETWCRFIGNSLLEATLDNGKQELTKDFRPDLPLIVHY